MEAPASSRCTREAGASYPPCSQAGAGEPALKLVTRLPPCNAMHGGSRLLTLYFGRRELPTLRVPKQEPGNQP